MLDKELLLQLQEYITRHIHDERLEEIVCKSSDYYIECEIVESIQAVELEDFIKTNRKPTFKEELFSLIDESGASDADVYKKAGIDRKLFSKIRSNSNYRPSKNTILALSFALELNKKEANKLLGSAGYSLSDSETSDLVILFCLEKKIYNIDDVNHALNYFSLKPLNGVR